MVMYIGGTRRCIAPGVGPPPPPITGDEHVDEATTAYSATIRERTCMENERIPTDKSRAFRFGSAYAGEIASRYPNIKGEQLDSLP